MKRNLKGSSPEAVENRARLQFLAIWAPNRKVFMREARSEGFGFWSRLRMAEKYMRLG